MSDCKHEHKNINRDLKLMSSPPKYNYICIECDYTGYVFCDDVDCGLDHRLLYWIMTMINNTKPPLGENMGYSLPACPKCGEELTK